jgi:ankyrin repeat protein
MIQDLFFDVRVLRKDEVGFVRCGGFKSMKRMSFLVVLAALNGCRASPPGSIGDLHDRIANGDIEQVRRMLDQDPALIRSTWQGRTLLRTAAECGHHDIIPLLIARGLDPNAREGTWGEAPLHFAAEKGDAPTVRALLANGASKEVKNDLGQTALFTAARAGKRDVVECLIRAGADINSAGHNGEAPLHAAAVCGDCAVLLTLLEAKPQIETQSVSGYTPLSLAAVRGNKAAARVLINHGARKDLLAAVALGDDTLVKAYLKQAKQRLTTNVETVGSLMHLAAREGQAGTIRTLAAHGLSVSVEHSGITPLHMASERGQTAAVVALADLGADVNKTDSLGRSALHWATKGNNLQVVEVLVARGADVNARDLAKDTVLHYAISHECDADIVKSLVLHGATSQTPGKDGRTPLDLAKHKRQGERYLAILKGQ